MARSGVEVEAQGYCYTFMDLLGWSLKADTEARCHNCHQVLYPKHTGMCDYVGYLREGGPIAIEVKATEDKRWSFNQWTPGQRRWAEAWNMRVSPDWPARYLWLQIGPERVNSSVVDFRRSAWLIPQVLVTAAEDMLATTGVKSIPMNAAALSKGTDDFSLALHATSLFNGYQLSWIKGFGWWPSIDSRLWFSMRINYHEPDYFIAYNARHPHPDTVGVDEAKGRDGAKVRKSSG